MEWRWSGEKVTERERGCDEKGTKMSLECKAKDRREIEER